MRLGEKPLKNRKPTYVLDATAVIHYAKVGKLRLISEICDAYITRAVYSEAGERNEGYSDSLVVRDAVDRGELKVYDVKKRKSVEVLLRHPEIHMGEAETLVAARELGGLAVLDEKNARIIASIYGIRAAPGTLFLLFRLLRLGKVSLDEAEETLSDLITSGLYLDPKTLLRAKERLEEYGAKRKSR
jgi:predicted nucleic acid-binding protein